jgi:hypothetical protein
MNFARLALPLIAALMLALATPPTDMVSEDREFELQVKQSAPVAGERLTVNFESVLEDSRCPTGADCIWSGNARIRLKLSQPGEAAVTIELNTHLEPRNATALKYEVRLVTLKPYPKLNEPIPPRAYKAVLKVSKR